MLEQQYSSGRSKNKKWCEETFDRHHRTSPYITIITDRMLPSVLPVLLHGGAVQSMRTSNTLLCRRMQATTEHYHRKCTALDQTLGSPPALSMILGSDVTGVLHTHVELGTHIRRCTATAVTCDLDCTTVEHSSASRFPGFRTRSPINPTPPYSTHYPILSSATDNGVETPAGTSQELPLLLVS